MSMYSGIQGSAYLVACTLRSCEIHGMMTTAIKRTRTLALPAHREHSEAHLVCPLLAAARVPEWWARRIQFLYILVWSGAAWQARDIRYAPCSCCMLMLIMAMVHACGRVPAGRQCRDVHWCSRQCAVELAVSLYEEELPGPLRPLPLSDSVPTDNHTYSRYLRYLPLYSVLRTD